MTKAVGHKLYNMKADHITISGPDSEQRILIAGYIENTSHSGSEGAAAYKFKLKCLAVLADSTVDEVKSGIDFWISDWSRDCSILLKKPTC